MKKLVFLYLLTTCIVQAQNDFEKPDYKKIEKVIKNEKSVFYYPKLMERFKAADTTLSLQEKRLLYYGYSFQEAYHPYGTSEYNDSLLVYLRKDMTEPRLDSIIYFADKILEEDPFNLRALNSELFAYKQKQMEPEFDKRLTQAYVIIDALLSSGDGKTLKTAFYVIYVPHEYVLLNYLGYEFGGEQSLTGQCDYLKLAENKDGLDGLYFDVSRSLNSLGSLLFKD